MQGAAAVTSLAGVGLSAYGSVLKGEGQAAGDQYQAERLDTEATYGRLKADQVGAQLTERLNITLQNIDAVRAAARDDPSSPTGQAVRDYQEMIGTRQKTITVDNILAQTQQNEADAAFYRNAASSALLSGNISAGAAILKGFAPAIGSMGAGGGGGVNPDSAAGRVAYSGSIFP